MEIIGMEFTKKIKLKKKSLSAKRQGSAFPQGRKELFTIMGERQTPLLMLYQGRSKCYRGCDDEQRLCYCTPGQEIMRLRRWKMDERASQTMFLWIGYYTREEEGLYLRRQNSIDCQMLIEHWPATGQYYTFCWTFGETRLSHGFLPYMWLLKESWVLKWGLVRMRWQVTTSKAWLETPGKMHTTVVSHALSRKLPSS